MDEWLDYASCGYLSIDQNRRIQIVNDTFCRLLAYEKLGIIGTSFESLLTRPSQVFFQIYFLPLINLNHQVNEMCLMMKTGSGGTLDVLLNAVVRGQGDELTYDCVLIPVLRRKDYEQQTEQADNAYRKAKEQLQRIEQELKTKEELESLSPPKV
ncbi:PAS domain-containing protein [Paenibacillus pabuli]|uniref:PAS domain-containing protein n=1 Tax=Paenibacillus pabuli TaxID=1472 RepID=UPI0007866FA8|nr:PAS domain-containing protein [Paenibacillus pabuli]MEC0128917.1 PAS domain-containing protein [Paenibacillus pabuli]